MRDLSSALLAACLVVAACGGDGPGGVCQSYGDTVCDLACACTDGPGCVIGFGGGSATVSFNSESDCRGFYVNLACNQEDPDFDYAGCTAVLDGAGCIDTDEGRALDHPACDMGAPAALP